MPFEPHTFHQYVTGLHLYYCMREDLEEAARKVGMSKTQLFRAATGYNAGRDGHAGREVFIEWSKALRSEEGAPCCGAHVVPGKRKPLPLNLPRRTAQFRELERLEEQIRRIKTRLGREEGGEEPGPST